MDKKPEPWMINFVSWLARNSVEVCKHNGKMFVRAKTENMSEGDLVILKEFEQMVLARNN